MKISDIRSNLIDIILALMVCFLLLIVTLDLKSDSIIIEKIKIPESFKRAGLSEEVIAGKFINSAKTLARKLTDQSVSGYDSSIGSYSLVSDTMPLAALPILFDYKKPDINISIHSTEYSFRSLIDFIKKELKYNINTVNIEIVEANNELRVFVLGWRSNNSIMPSWSSSNHSEDRYLINRYRLLEKKRKLERYVQIFRRIA